MPYLAMEFRHGLRQIRKSPGFFALAIFLVAMGIASTTLIFTLLNAVLLRPFSVRDPQNLVQLFEQQPRRPADPYFDYRSYRRLTDASSTLFDIAGQRRASPENDVAGREGFRGRHGNVVADASMA